MYQLITLNKGAFSQLPPILRGMIISVHISEVRYLVEWKIIYFSHNTSGRWEIKPVNFFFCLFIFVPHWIAGNFSTKNISATIIIYQIFHFIYRHLLHSKLRKGERKPGWHKIWFNRLWFIGYDTVKRNPNRTNITDNIWKQRVKDRTTWTLRGTLIFKSIDCVLLN